LRIACPTIPFCIVCLFLGLLYKLDRPIGPWYSAYTLGYSMMLASLCVLCAVAIVLMPLRLTNAQNVLIRQNGIFHLTEPRNFQSIMSENRAEIRRSNWIWNIGNICIGRCAFFFAREPNSVARFLNLFGRHRPGEYATVHLDGEDLPEELYTRLLDKAILIPDGHQGKARWIEP